MPNKPMQPGAAPQSAAQPQQKPNTALGTTHGLLKPVQAAAGMKPILPLKPKNTTGKYGPQPMGQQQKPVSKAIKAYKPPNPFKVGAGRAGRKVKVKVNNITSKPADRGAKGEGGKFGKPTGKYGDPGPNAPFESQLAHEEDVASRPVKRMYGAAYGLVGGSAIGAGTGAVHGRKKHPDSKQFGKAFANGPHLITDVGTKAGKFKRWPELPTKSIVGGTAVGIGLGHHGGVQAKKEEAKIVQQRRRKQARAAVVTKALNATKDERHRALVWNDHFVPKKSPYTKGERRIAAKIQNKEQTKGQLKGIAAGGAAGAAVGAAASKHKVTRGRNATIAGAIGAVAGQQRGDYVGRVKGQRKYKAALEKSASVSAFGVSHG